MADQRTTHRSTADKKLYAVRDSEGRIKDIRQYERAHRRYVRRTSEAEARAAAAEAGEAAVVDAAPAPTAARALLDLYAHRIDRTSWIACASTNGR